MDLSDYRSEAEILQTEDTRTPAMMPQQGRRRLPIDRSVEFDPEQFPPDPEAYEPLVHFYQRQKAEERLLERPLDSKSAVRATICKGVLQNGSDGCGEFVHRWHGVTYHVVVGFHTKGYRIAITGWPELEDRETALDSGAWNPRELETIEAFNENAPTYN